MRIFNPKTIVQFLCSQKEDRAGYLWKRKSENKGSFKRRYFVACGNILAYYEKKADKEPLGVLFLENHVIEMVDDLTMAVKFLTIKELPKGYYLRGESTEDIEQWMRVLSRSGTDFFTLTLEDLEDQLRAVAAVNRVSSPGTLLTSAGHSAPPSSSSSRLNQLPRRPNPFDSYNRSAAAVGVSSASPSNRCNSPKRPPQCSAGDLLSSGTNEQGGIGNDSERGPISAPVQRYLRWLFAQDWEKLHAKARAQLSEGPAPLLPTSSVNQLQDK